MKYNWCISPLLRSGEIVHLQMGYFFNNWRIQSIKELEKRLKWHVFTLSWLVFKFLHSSYSCRLLQIFSSSINNKGYRNRKTKNLLLDHNFSTIFAVTWKEIYNISECSTNTSRTNNRIDIATIRLQFEHYLNRVEKKK